MKIDKILIATDLSDPSLVAIEAGIELAHKFDAEIVMGYVAEDHLPPLGIVEYAGVNLAAIEQEHRAKATERLEGYARDIAERGGKAGIDVAQGVPHHQIVEMAKRHDADLIVMGTHGRGFVSHALLGSTTERVLRRSPCPLFVVRDPRK